MNPFNTVYRRGALTRAARDLDRILLENKQELKRLRRLKKPTFQNFAIPFMMISERISWNFGIISHLEHVVHSRVTHRLYDAYLEKVTAFSTTLWQDEKLYRRFLLLRDDAALDPVQQRYVTKSLRDFELGGVALKGVAKKRYTQIVLRLSELESAFGHNLLKATNAFELLVEESALGEMPATDREAARVERDGTIKYRFTLHAPSYIAFMTHSPDRALREELYRAHVTRAPENSAVITEILALREEKANLLGFATYAELSLASKEAPSPAEVDAFLCEIARKARPYATEELTQLQARAAAEGITQLAPYDTAYLSEKIRKETLQIDEEAYRPYFEKERVVEGMLAFTAKLFGIEFHPVRVAVWHPSVEVHDLYCAGSLIGRLYIDLENRPTKRGGAWMDNWCSHGLDDTGRMMLPVVHIVGNFPPATATTPSLLKHSDIETLFHEMGHALHHLMSKVDVVALSGVNGIAWDTVEFPSQFYENFAFEASALQRFARHYQTGELLPEAMIQRLNAVKNFQAGLSILRQVEFALFDLRLHKSRARSEAEVQQMIQSVRAEVSLLMPPTYNRFEHGFSHIFAGGYAAGYYSYKWAEVMSADLFLALKESNDASLPAKIRAELFAKGASEPMASIFQAMLGRAPDPTALLRLYGINLKTR